MSRSITSLRFPGESTWEIWRCNRAGVLELCPGADGAEKVTLHGIQALCVDSSPFWQAAGEAGISAAAAGAADVALLRWEGVGVSDADGSCQSALWMVAEQPHRALMGSAAISADMTEHESLSAKAEQYDISARMLPLPHDGVALWRELGRTVAAFTRAGGLLHVTVLSAPHLDVEAVDELRCVMLALDAQEFLDRMTEVRVWMNCDETFTQELAQALGAQEVRAEPRPAPSMPQKLAALVPMEVAQQRKEQRQRLRMVQIATAVAAVFVIFFSAWAALLFRREARLNAGEAELRTIAPQVLAVSEAQNAWQALEPAVNPDFYPMEVYHQVLSVIKPNGLRLNSFDIEEATVKLTGVVSDNTAFFEFRDALTSNLALARFEWVGKADQNLSFDMTGTLTTGGAQ
ncbi:MAG: hypothetical protein IPK32_05660 [Verrucomicrobiaceae bacterium]|nr:hypothetical protein [Verrucomicrobiaceae bacterium]